MHIAQILSARDWWTIKETELDIAALSVTGISITSKLEEVFWCGTGFQSQ